MILKSSKPGKILVYKKNLLGQPIVWQLVAAFNWPCHVKTFRSQLNMISMKLNKSRSTTTQKKELNFSNNFDKISTSKVQKNFDKWSEIFQRKFRHAAQQKFQQWDTCRKKIVLSQPCQKNFEKNVQKNLEIVFKKFRTHSRNGQKTEKIGFQKAAKTRHTFEEMVGRSDTTIELQFAPPSNRRY